MDIFSFLYRILVYRTFSIDLISFIALAFRSYLAQNVVNDRRKFKKVYLDAGRSISTRDTIISRSQHAVDVR